MMLSVEQFKPIVKKACDDRGLTFAEVSRRAGHARNWLQERMQGRTVEESTIKQVAKVLKVPQAYFFVSGR
jgi:transcriptional regulator with XRE-family HTH domain